MDLVLITAYNRPDYLRLCLEYLSKVSEIQNKEIRIYVDRGRVLVREFYEVFRDFPTLNISSVFRSEHDYHGNSFNTLEAYKDAFQSGARYIYLIEDDVLVTPDFFRWHETVQQQEDLMCSVAYRCSRNAAIAKSDDPEAYLLSGQDYASIGVCWRREKLAPIIEHARTEYYENLDGYLKKHFPNNRFSNCFTEQDGLIMRIMAKTGGIVAWPFVPRCYHIGFAGYNRPKSARLSYQELKETIHNMEKIRQADKDFGDIEMVPIDMNLKWKTLKCEQRFN